MTTARDDQYPDRDLVTGYITRPGVRTFHVARHFPPETDSPPRDPTNAACGIELVMLRPAGWARGLIRRGLQPCSKGCGRALRAEE